jgi:hypothetical protein
MAASAVLTIFRLPCHGPGKTILAVPCDEPKEFPFASSRTYAQEGLGITSVLSSMRFQSFADDHGEWPKDLMNAMKVIDPKGQWVALHGTVQEGPFIGAEAIGLGSNRDKQQRACSIALLRSVTHLEGLDPCVQDLFANTKITKVKPPVNDKTRQIERNDRAMSQPQISSPWKKEGRKPQPWINSPKAPKSENKIDNRNIGKSKIVF